MGQPCDLYFDAFPDQNVSGKISRIVTKRADADKPVYTVFIQTENTPKDLVGGMTADATIVIDQKTGVLRLPRTAIRSLGTEKAEVEVWTGSATEKRTIQVGLRGDSYVEVLSGLKEGERGGGSMSALLIETQELTRTYSLGKTQVPALRGVNLHIAQGEFVALMGSSGCGKSTLLHLLGCLDAPTSGRYFLEGREVGELSLRERSLLRGQRLGFVFQSFFLIPNLTAVENVTLPLLYQSGTRRSKARQQAMTALERVGLAQRAGHRPVELSGGERQRVAIARALVNHPALLLADEPTGNLDSANGAEVMTMLVELWQAGLTILLVTHDPDIAEYTQRSLWMKDGRIVQERTSAEVNRREHQVVERNPAAQDDRQL